MRWIVRGAVLLMLIPWSSSTAGAQQAPNVDIGLGYGQLRVLDLVQHGFAAQVHLPVTDYVGIEAYISRYWVPNGDAFGVNTLGGRVTLREIHPRVIPYLGAGIDFFDIDLVDARSGGTMQNRGVNAFRFGGGTDIELTPAVAFRVDSRVTPMRFFDQSLGRHRWRAGWTSRWVWRSGCRGRCGDVATGRKAQKRNGLQRAVHRVDHIECPYQARQRRCGRVSPSRISLNPSARGGLLACMTSRIP